jgi:3-carboxy-cis,cis-muconate cycloisomerase
MYSLYLSDPETNKLCSQENFIAQMLRFEVALAKVQGKLGIIPKDAAQSIVKNVEKIQISPTSLAEGTLQNGIPTITLLNEVKKQLPDIAKDYLHFGATTQDVMDTAQVLILQNVIEIFEKRLRQAVQNLAEHIENHKSTQIIGRTRTQQAVPITFGLKVTTWAMPLLRHLQRLKELKKRLLVVQFGGAAGNLSALNDKGIIIGKALAKELKLHYSITWHTQRDNMAEFANWLALVNGTLGKMGQDILIMSQTEIGEIIENAEGGGKSSTMPHKNNPILSEALVSLSRQNAQLAALQLQSMVHSNERDGAAWSLEWQNLPTMMTNCGAALTHALTISNNLKINVIAAQRNIESLNGLILSEAASFLLAQHISRNEAKKLVEKACKMVLSEGKNLTEILEKLTPDLKIDWKSELKIENNLGVSQEMIEIVLKEISSFNTEK